MLYRISEDAPLVLGSASPRRSDLLRGMHVPIVIRPPDANEDVRPGEPPAEYLTRVVAEKLARATELGRGLSAAGVLVADTTVLMDDVILGKPRDPAEARHMVQTLSGRTHQVWTRFALGTLPAAEEPETCLHAETVVTKVTFRALSPDEVDAYVALGEGVDKAGSYAAQGVGASLIARIDGSYTNVVGLPLAEVVVALRRFGAL